MLYLYGIFLNFFYIFSPTNRSIEIFKISVQQPKDNNTRIRIKKDFFYLFCIKQSNLIYFVSQ